MPFKETVTVYSESHSKQIIHCVGKIKSYLLLKKMLQIVTTGLQNVNFAVFTSPVLLGRHLMFSGISFLSGRVPVRF